MRWNRLSIILGAAIVGGCLDFGALSGTGDDAGVTDSGNDAAALGDAAGSDASASQDSDARDGDAGAFSCADLFSDNFDQAGQIIGQGWTSIDSPQDLDAGGLLSFDTTSFASPPSSLLAQTPADGGEAFVARTFASAKHMCCAFAFRAPPGTFVGPMIRGMGGDYKIALSFTDGVGFVPTENYYAGPASPGISRQLGVQQPTTDAWATLLLDVSFPGGAGTGTLTEVLSGTAQTFTIGSADYDLTVDTLAVGVVYGTSPNAGLIRFDDVSCGTGR
jgi:hypothetical protein